jgi:hypothetical protein
VRPEQEKSAETGEFPMVNPATKAENPRKQDDSATDIY